MDRETRLLLGKMLGEIYRLQRGISSDLCQVTDTHIYALRNGFEHAINEEMGTICAIAEEELNATCDVLSPYFDDKDKLDKFTGFYEIEEELKSRGVDRIKAIKILTYLYADGRFIEVLEKMDSHGSPHECRKFGLERWEK